MAEESGLESWQPQRDLNPCRRLEKPEKTASGRQKPPLLTHQRTDDSQEQPLGGSDPVALHALGTAIRTWPGIDEATRRKLLTQLDENLKA